jgi:hypothetical protein
LEESVGGIQPGTLCFIVQCDNAAWKGRVVVTGRRLSLPGSPIDGQWEVFAHWLPPALPCWYAQPWALRPIYNPGKQAASVVKTGTPEPGPAPGQTDMKVGWARSMVNFIVQPVPNKRRKPSRFLRFTPPSHETPGLSG